MLWPAKHLVKTRPSARFSFLLANLLAFKSLRIMHQVVAWSMSPGLIQKRKNCRPSVVCRTDPEGAFFYLGMAGQSVSW